MNRAHDHGHHHGTPNFNRAFAIGVTLNVVFVVIEAIYGVLADSLALLTDAGHNLIDVVGLLLAWGAAVLASRSPSARRTYGWSRATILASLISGLLLLAAVGAIVWEAIGRLADPPQPAGLTIMVVAGIGVIINTATALMFVTGKDHDLNIRGAFLHMAADAAVSLAVVISGLLIWRYGFAIIDPLISLAVAAVILWSAWGLVRESMNLAIDAVPDNIDPDAVRGYLRGLDGVDDVHDLHIWPMSTTDTAMTAHLVMPEYPREDSFLHQVVAELKQRFHIDHATLQIERGAAASDCHQNQHCAE